MASVPDPDQVKPWYLRNITEALALDAASGNVYMRTGITGDVIIEGNVTIPEIVQVYSNINAPIHNHITEVGTSGILNVPYLPIGGNVIINSGNVDANVQGNVGIIGNINIGTMPEVEIKNNSGNPIPVTGNITTTVVPIDYARDAYHRPKVVQDYSIFNGEATLRIPKRVWEQETFNLNVVPATVTHSDVDGVHILSEDHMFTVKSGTVANYGYSLKTKEFFRVQSNRGGLYSWSAEYPNPNAAGARAIGPSSGENGISLFMVGTGTGWTLYYSRRNDNAVAAQVDLAPYLPAGFDPAKGHLYDMRIQWRGVGNVEIFIDGALIYTEEILGTLTGLSVADNSLPFVMASSCSVNGTQVALKVGCVNLSSEGGGPQPGVFGSVNTGDSPVQVDTTITPTIALRVPRFITYNGNTIQNTRGVIMTKAVQWLRDEGAMIAYVGRDYNVPNLNGLTWTATNDSNVQYLIGGDASLLNTAFQTDNASCAEVVREYSEIETKNIITNPGRDDFLLTPGDILIVCAKPLANNKQCFTTLYYSEQL